ncbi:MAG TPA: hypothetical protein VGK73_33290 [Polyangiaceae bacterium]
MTPWPKIKRGNPYRLKWTIGFSSGSVANCVALLIIKRYLITPDSQALIVAASAPVDGFTLNGTLTLAAGAEPLTAEIGIDIPASTTALLPPQSQLRIGLQINLPNGDPLEFDEDLLASWVFVEGDVAHFVPPTP